MASKQSHEGYLLIDNRAAGSGLFETATFTCSHCQKVVVKNPLRQRERAYCTGCDHYLCDACGAIRAARGGECKTFEQIISEYQELVSRNIPITNSTEL